MDANTIAKVQGFGFDVYMHKPDSSWLVFTDGNRIGSLGMDRFGGFNLNTIHKPNTTSGTAFSMHSEVGDFDKSMLEDCFNTGPHWAFQHFNSVKKYKNIEEYLKINGLNYKKE